MSRQKQSKVAGVLKYFRFDQPFMGFSTKFRSLPLRRGKARTHSINYGGSCREELIWDTREYLQKRSVTTQKTRGTWRVRLVKTHRLDVDHQSLKQPNVTYLWLNEDEDCGVGKLVCYRPCCAGKFLELMDAFVGSLGVVLNPDRYQGSWWATEPGEATNKKRGTHGTPEYRWFGIDNFFLHHPVLTSLVMGMFRQGCLLFQQGFDEAILKTVKRKEVEEALTNSDPVLAMRILTKLRPWIEVPQTNYANLAPFPRGHWDRLGLLHRALYKYGYEEVFAGDLQEGWNIQDSEEEGEDLNANNPRYEVATGPMKYWGSTPNLARTENVDGRRLAQLGK